MIQEVYRRRELIPTGDYCIMCSWLDARRDFCNKYLEEISSFQMKIEKCESCVIPAHWIIGHITDNNDVNSYKRINNPNLMAEYQIGPVWYEKISTKKGVRHYKRTISKKWEKQLSGEMDRWEVTKKTWEKETNTPKKHIVFERSFK